MKLLIGLALIVAVSCDVSHLQGQGWSKDENGYNYPKPAAKLDEVAPAVAYVEEAVPEEPYVEELQTVEEGCTNGGYGPFCCINGADNEDCYVPEPEAPATYADEPVYEEVYVEEPVDEPVQYDFVQQDAVAEVPSADYLPPSGLEYLPPAEQAKLRKRQAQAKRLVPVKRQTVRRVNSARRPAAPAKRQVVQARRPVVQAKRPVRPVQVKRQAARPVVQARPKQVQNYRVVRRQ